MLKFQNFGCPPGQPRLPALFSGAVGKISKFLLAKFCLPCCPDSEKVWHNPPAPKPSEEVDLAETPLFGVWAWPEDPEVRITCQKITCKELSRPQKFCADPSNESNVTALFLHGQLDGHTDGQTHRHWGQKIRRFLHNCKVVWDLLKNNFDLCTCVIRCFPWPPGAQEEHILQDLNTPCTTSKFQPSLLHEVCFAITLKIHKMSSLVEFVYQDLLCGLNELTSFQPQTLEDLYSFPWIWSTFIIHGICYQHTWRIVLGKFFQNSGLRLGFADAQCQMHSFLKPVSATQSVPIKSGVHAAFVCPTCQDFHELYCP